MTSLRLLAACVGALVLAMTLLSAGSAAVNEEVAGNETRIDAPQEEVVILGAELYATISPFIAPIVAIGLLVAITNSL